MGYPHLQIRCYLDYVSAKPWPYAFYNRMVLLYICMNTLLHCSLRWYLCQCSYLQMSLFLVLSSSKNFCIWSLRHKNFYSSSSSMMAGTPMVYKSSCVKSTNLKWLYFCSACPSSSNRLNAWILFRLSISTIISWPGKCWSNHLHVSVDHY